MATHVVPSNAPLKDIDEWDDFLTGRYQEGKSEAEFRQYDEKATPGVAEFYRLNHQYQTFDYVIAKEKEYFGLNKGEKSIWEVRGCSAAGHIHFSFPADVESRATPSRAFCPRKALRITARGSLGGA